MVQLAAGSHHIGPPRRAAPSLTQLSPRGPWAMLPGHQHPGARFGHAVATDPAGRPSSVWIYGGLGSHNRSMGDLWVFDGDALSWTEVLPHGGQSPPARHGAGLQYAWPRSNPLYRSLSITTVDLRDADSIEWFLRRFCKRRGEF